MGLPRLPDAVPTAPAWLQRAGLGADVIGTGATQRGSEGGGRLMLTPLFGHIADGTISAGLLITGTVGVDGVVQAFEDLASPDRDATLTVEPWRS